MSAVSFALSLAFKLQAVFILPVVAILWSARKLRLEDALTFIVTLAATALPALIGGKSVSQILSIYITDSPQSITYGVDRLAFLLLPYFLLGLHEVTSGTLRGMGASLTPMIVSVLGVCGFRILWVETIFQIPQFHTPDWLFVSYPISWALTYVTELILLVIVYRRYAAKCRKAEVSEHGME